MLPVWARRNRGIFCQSADEETARKTLALLGTRSEALLSEQVGLIWTNDGVAVETTATHSAKETP